MEYKGRPLNLTNAHTRELALRDAQLMSRDDQYSSLLTWIDGMHKVTKRASDSEHLVLQTRLIYVDVLAGILASDAEFWVRYLSDYVAQIRYMVDNKPGHKLIRLLRPTVELLERHQLANFIPFGTVDSVAI